MNTKRFFMITSHVVLLVMLTTLSFGCLNIPNDPGSGNPVKEERTVGNFSKIDIGGAFQVFLTQGGQEKLVVEADADEMDEIITEVVGSTLKIYTKPGWHGNYHEMTIYLTFKEIDDMELGGAIELEGQGMLSFTDLKMEVSGAAEIDMDFTASKLDAEFSGASEIEFTGKCENGYFDISGASEMSAAEMVFTNLVIEVSGASEAQVNVTGELNIDASGASDIRYKGSAKVSIESSGASTVKEL